MLGYLHGREKQQYFNELSRIKLNDYPFHFDVKIYNTGEFLVCTYNEQHELVILNAFLIMKPELREFTGLTISLMDKQKYKITTVTCVPKLLLGYDVVVQTPVDATIERTVKILPGGKVMRGNTVPMIVKQKSMTSDAVVGHHYLVPAWKAVKVFGREQLKAAVDRGAEL